MVNNYKAYLQKNNGAATPVRSVLEPHALNDAGSMAAAMINAMRAGADHLHPTMSPDGTKIQV